MSGTSTPTIELITMSPGDELYTLWGHAALRVRRSHPRSDVGYNFGSVDIGPGFFWDMLGGHVRAYVGKGNFARVASIYRGEDRQIVRRRLNLDPIQARALAERLESLPGSEAARYNYHHFKDNCSTRVADEINTATGGALKKTGSSTSAYTYRQLALQKIRPRTFVYTLVDILLARGLDDPISEWQASFLPDQLAELVDKTTVDGHPIVRFKEELAGSSKSRNAENWAWPWIKIYLLFCLPMIALILKAPRLGTLIWGSLAGLLGVIALAGSVLTDYTFLAGNWNVGVLLPTQLLAAAAMLKKTSRERYGQAIAAHAAFGVVLMMGILSAHELGALAQNVAPVVGFALGPTAAIAWRLRSG